MAENPRNPADDPMEVFKLSYPVNPKIPFIADCLKLKTIKNEPRLFTTRNLKPGDIIFEEDMVFPRVFSSAGRIHCCYCTKPNNYNLIPCLKTANLMYCSVECRNKAYKFHGDNLDDIWIHNGDVKMINTDRIIIELQEAFGGHEELLKFLKENDLDKMKKTIFDFDWREDAEKKKLICCLSLDTTQPKEFSFAMTPASNKLTRGQPEYEKLREKLLKIFKIYGTLLFDTTENYKDEEYFGLTMFFANVRSSCMPNMDVRMVEDKVFGYATKVIKAGQEITFAKG
jgi:hypothetical protein